MQGAAQALVFRFVAPAILEKAIEKMEEHVRPGLLHLADADVKQWRELETLDELHLPTDRPVRLLLFVHGTFSSTVGGFGALGIDENGQGFLRTAISAYDAVIGFDHKTLSLDPRQNAQDLLTRLQTHHPEAELVIDIVTHSRGGLVTRSFVEQLLPGSGWPATVDNVVFVASTNAGTHLADPKRWSDLVDLYTNLAAAGASGLAMLPGAAPVAAVVGGVVKGIGAFVKYLVSYAAKGDDVPGLKAMVPGGAFVKEINKTQQGQPGPGTNWYVVSSNFHVKLFDDSHNPPEFPRELVVKLGEGFVDQLFEGPNDLVVDVSSMDAIDAKVGGFVREVLALGENDTVYHTNYFSQLSRDRGARRLAAAGSRAPAAGDDGRDAPPPAWAARTRSLPDRSRPSAGAPEPPAADRQARRRASRPQRRCPNRAAAYGGRCRQPPEQRTKVSTAGGADAGRTARRGRRADPRQPGRRDARRTSSTKHGVRRPRPALAQRDRGDRGDGARGGATSRSTPTARSRCR